MKVCCTCKIEKSVSDFNKHKNTPDRLQTACKDCNKRYRLSNKETAKLNQKKWREKNELRNKELQTRWLNENRERVRDVSNKNFNQKYNTDPLCKLKKIMRVAVHNALKSKGKKKSKTQDILGCSWDELKSHIEKQFKPGMTWENHTYYGWHIDHIYPISLAKSEEEVYRLSHYTNLQPLWWDENLNKSNKII